MVDKSGRIKIGVKRRALALFMAIAMVLSVLMPIGNGIAVHADPVTSNKLVDFLNEVTIKDSSGNETSVLRRDTTYNIFFDFREGSAVQFNNEAEFTFKYDCPDELTLSSKDGTIPITIHTNDGDYTVAGNPYTINSDGTVTFKFNVNDPNYDKIADSTSTWFQIQVEAQLSTSASDDLTQIDFGNKIIKNVTIDTSKGVSASKSYSYFDNSNGLAWFTVNISSVGTNTNVTINDTLNDGLTFDGVSVDQFKIPDSLKQSFNATLTSNGFSGTITSLPEGNYSISYPAKIDTTKINTADADKNGKLDIGNTISVSSDEDTTPNDNESSVTKTNEVQYSSISKSNSVGTKDSNNKVTTTWTITANPEKLISLGGTSISDTLSGAAKSDTAYSGSGITVNVEYSDGQTETRNVKWSELASSTSDSWTYNIPAGDAVAKYTITYTTETDVSSYSDDTSVSNTTTYQYGSGNSTGYIGVGEASKLSVTKTALEYDTDKAKWKIDINVPAKGYNSFVVTDSLPNAWIDNDNRIDDYIDETISVSGLVDSESYVLNKQDDKLYITFYQDAQQTVPGLKSSASNRTVSITLETEIDDYWYNNADLTQFPYLADHTNNVLVNADGTQKSDSATVKPPVASCAKSIPNDGTSTGTVDIGGVTYPWYKYDVLVSPVSADFDIEDTFDTSIFKLYTDKMNNESDQLVKAGAGQYYQDPNGGTIDFTNTKGTSTGAVISVIPNKDSSTGEYYMYYKVSYYLIPKDAEALKKLKTLALAEDNCKYSFNNTASYKGKTSTASQSYTYGEDALIKELTNKNKLGKPKPGGGYEHIAHYKITVNPDALDLNPNGDTIEVEDSFSGLNIEYSSIKITPTKASDSYNYSNTTGTFVLSDNTAYTIEYDSMLLYTSGKISSFSNEATIKGGSKTFDSDKIEDSVSFSNEQGGGNAFSINVLKYEATDMTKPLEGAIFQLYKYNSVDGKYEPYKTEDNKEITATTKANGKCTFAGSTADKWHLYPGTKYALKEISSPKGYDINDTLFTFELTDDYSKVSYTPGNYVYMTGTELKVYDQKSTTPLTGDLEVSKTVSSDLTADSNKEFEFTVKLGDDTITGTYGDMTFTNGVATITLKDGEKKTATGLPQAIEYTVTETAADGFSTTKTGDTGTISATKSEAKFINTRKVGNLNVEKILVSDLAADSNEEFEFTVTLGDDTITGTYGDMAFTKGVATFKLKGGESKSATGLPESVTYTVTETSNTDFTTSKIGDTGSISSQDSKTAAFTNTRKTGDLEVSKSVVSSTASDKNKDFDFVVSLSDTSISGTYGDMTFTSGVASFTLKDNEKKTATGLPQTVGYTVTETAADGFVTTQTGSTGTISATKSEAKFTNTKQEGGLAVTKTVVSDMAADSDKEFDFTVTLNDNTINGTYGGMTFTNGVATFSLKNGESASSTGLPEGVTYTVVETEDTGFTTTKTGDTGTISNTTPSTATFTNTRKTGDLEVSKSVVSSTASDKNKDFSFTVTLSDTSINGTYGGMTFTKGVATFTLKDGEKKTATGLPQTVRYTVSETAAAGFTTTKTGDTGTISATKSEAKFTNTKETGNLSVSKALVSDLATDKDQQFDFTVTLGDKTINGTFGGMTFTNGVATFSLKGGESKSATNLPDGVSYTVTEANVNGFINTDKTGDTGTISSGDTSEAVFTNTRETGNLKVSKTVSSSKDVDFNKEFNFKVSLNDTGISGTYGDMSFTNGVSNFTLKNGESKTAFGLPQSVQYTVEEASVSNCTTTKTGDSGSISNALSEAKFTNSFSYPTVVKVSKIDVEDGQELDGAVIQVIDSTGDIAKDVNGDLIEWVSTTEPHEVVGLSTGETYKLRETVAPEGYAIALESLFKLKSDGTIDANATTATFDNDGILYVEDAKTKVKISKVDITSGDEVAGAHIQILDEQGNVVKDANGGNIEWDSTTTPKEIEGLKTGVTYTLRETVAPEGYAVTTDTTFKLKADGIIDTDATTTKVRGSDGALLVEDTKTKVKISKVDITSGDEVAGAHIQILDEQGNVVKDASGGNIEWDSTTTAKEIEGLKTGVTYTLRETVAPEGYAVTTDTTFMIEADGKITTTATISADGTILVEDAKTSVKISKVDVTNEKELAGAHIQILDEQGNVVKDASGANIEWDSTTTPHEINGLKTGVTYTLRETVAPNGYQITTDTTFTLDKYGNVDASKTTTTQNATGVLLVEDWPQGSIVLNKEGLLNETCSNESSLAAPLKDVEFTITKVGDAAFKPVTSVSDKDGIVTFTNLDAGTYNITETKTVGEYVLDTNTYTAEIDAKGNYSGLKDSKGNAVAGNKLTNDLYRGDIEFVKVNLDKTDEVLPGSTYGLYISKGDLYSRTGKTLGTGESKTDLVKLTQATTDSKGRIKFEGVLTNVEYTVQEEVAPSGYYVSEKPIKLKLTKTNNGSVQMSMVNDGNGTVKVDANGNITWLEPEIRVSFLKTDEAGEPLAGAKLKVVDDNGKDVISWTSTDSAYEVDGKFVSGKTYKLVETEAPSGYELAEPVSFSIAEKAGEKGADVIKVEMKDKKTPEKSDTPSKPTEEKETSTDKQDTTDKKDTTNTPGTPSKSTEEKNTTTTPGPSAPSTPEKQGTTVNTGDSNPVIPVAILLVIAFIGIIGILILKKKEK